MKQAYDWSHSDTGAGLLESHGPTTFRESVLEKCQYYYDLEDKFTSRSGIAPKAFSKDIGDWLEASDSDECVVAGGADERVDVRRVASRTGRPVAIVINFITILFFRWGGWSRRRIFVRKKVDRGDPGACTSTCL